MSTFNELIDFTRSTTGTYLDSVVYGEELVTNGTFATDSDWSKGATWSFSEGRATHATGNSGSLKQTVTTVANKKYVLTCEVVSTSAILLIGISSIGQNFTSATGSGVFSFTFTAPDTTSQVEIYQSSGATCIIDNVSVKEVIGGQVSGTPLLRTAAINEPRLEYDASGNPLGLLIEEARTNLISLSNFNNVSKQNVTTVNDYTVAPDGTNTAVAMFETINNSFHRAFNSASYLNGNTYTQSVFLKSIGGRAGQLTLTASGFGTVHANFDLVNGVVGTKNNCESQITPAGNGWYRCSITATALNNSGGDASVVSVTSPTSIRLENFAGDTSKGLLVYGLQVETGAFPTSYIPTSGSTVTRAKDLASLPVERFAYNQPQGTVVAFQETFGTAGNLVPWEIHTATTNRIVYNAKSSLATIITGGLVQASLNHADQLPSVFYKHGLAFKKDDIASSLDASILTDTSGTIPTVSSFKIGTDSALLAMLNGHIKQIQYYPKRLSNTELQLLTQPSASPTMNLTFDGQATSTLVEGLHD